MAAYTKNTPGAPTSGIYALFDTVTDSVGVVWQCILAGPAYPQNFVATPIDTLAGSAALSMGTAGTGVTARHFGADIIRRTKLTLTNIAQTVTNGTEYQSSLIYTFPEGRLVILGLTATLRQTTTSALAGTLNASSTGAVALGSAAASNTTLSSAMVNMLPSTAFTSSATINVAGTAVTAALAAAAQIDGTSTPVPMYLNSAFATTTDVDGDATQTFSGTIDLLWAIIGDL